MWGNSAFSIAPNLDTLQNSYSISQWAANGSVVIVLPPLNNINYGSIAFDERVTFWLQRARSHTHVCMLLFLAHEARV